MTVSVPDMTLFGLFSFFEHSGARPLERGYFFNYLLEKIFSNHLLELTSRTIFWS